MGHPPWRYARAVPEEWSHNNGEIEELNYMVGSLDDILQAAEIAIRLSHRPILYRDQCSLEQRV